MLSEAESTVTVLYKYVCRDMLTVLVWNVCNACIGGGFGGKETRSFMLSTSLAVAAHKSVKS